MSRVRCNKHHGVAILFKLQHASITVAAAAVPAADQFKIAAPADVFFFHGTFSEENAEIVHGARLRLVAMNDHNSTPTTTTTTNEGK